MAPENEIKLKKKNWDTLMLKHKQFRPIIYSVKYARRFCWNFQMIFILVLSSQFQKKITLSAAEAVKEKLCIFCVASNLTLSP